MNDIPLKLNDHVKIIGVDNHFIYGTVVGIWDGRPYDNDYEIKWHDGVDFRKYGIYWPKEDLLLDDDYHIRTGLILITLI